MEIDKKILKTTVNMVWPAILESFFFALAGIVDSYMVSSLGANAVGGVGLVAQPKFVILAVCIATNISVSALVARRFGEKRREEANRILITGTFFVLFVAFLLTLITLIFADDIMRLCGSTSENHHYAVTYFRILMGGMVFNIIQMIINAGQRGAGNTSIAMRTNVVSNTVNVLLNYLLIGGNFGFPRLGIAGAALATVLGTVVASIMSLLSVGKKDCFLSLPYIMEKRIRPSLSTFKSMVKIGYSLFVEQVLMRAGFLATSLMAAHQGNDSMAAHYVGMNLLALSFALGDGLQVTAVALIGKSLGERRKDLAKAYGKTCRYLGMILSICISVVYFFTAEEVFRLFFTEDHIVELGIQLTRVLILILLFQIPQVVYTGALRGAGDTFFTAVSSTISITVIRTAGSYFFGYVLGMGIVGIWIGILCDQISRFIMSGLRFRSGKWMRIRI